MSIFCVPFEKCYISSLKDFDYFLILSNLWARMFWRVITQGLQWESGPFQEDFNWCMGLGCCKQKRLYVLRGSFSSGINGCFEKQCPDYPATSSTSSQARSWKTLRGSCSSWLSKGVLEWCLRFLLIFSLNLEYHIAHVLLCATGFFEIQPIEDSRSWIRIRKYLRVWSEG